MFKTYNQGQNFLLPPNFKEFIWESHESIILDELINEFDISKLIKSYSNENVWASAYHPRMLLKIMIYAYMNKTFSSRKIASKLKTDLAFMYLAWNNQPKFRTINNFRKEKWKYFEDIFVQIVLKAKKLGMINFWTLSLDWTKIYANASKYNNIDDEKLTKKIKKLVEEAEKIDSIEDWTYWENNENKIPDDLKTAELRLKKKEELKKKN